MADTDYAPYDEDGLRAVLGYHNQAARNWKEGSPMYQLHKRLAASCENALKSFDAQRDRMHALRLQLSQWEQPS